MESGWEQLDYDSGDIVILQLTGTWGQLVIFNIYNGCSHNRTIYGLTEYCNTNQRHLQGNDTETINCHMIWLGDFNRHHPAWGSLEDSRLFMRDVTEAADVLIKAVADLGMEMTLPPGVLTHVPNITKKWTRLDHVFMMEQTTDRVIICEVQVNDRGLNTDHVPILMKLDASLGRTPAVTTRNFRDVVWEDFHKSLEVKISNFGLPRKIANQAELNHECKRVTKALQETIKEEVPKSKLCPHSKHWWTKELKELRARFCKLGRKIGRYRHQPEHVIHNEFREVQREYDRAIKYNKQHHWRDWLERATDPDIWTANKYITAPASDGRKTRIPVLRQTSEGMELTASTNSSKSKMLARTFF